MDVVGSNRKAWDRAVALKNRWTIPVSADEVAKAREGEWSVLLTPTRPVPRDWFGSLAEADVLALASGGGQQGPILAAAGANVTVFDNSPAQLEQDRMVSARENLHIETVLGDMADLSHFPKESFDLIFHPCSNSFVPDIKAVWREAYRVLRRGGILLSGYNDPILFALDAELEAKGIAQLKHLIPYSDIKSKTDEERARMIENGEALSFGHTLEDQIGGQLRAGFVITGYYDDVWPDVDLVSRFLPAFGATRAEKQ